jgi:hypothetical protein
MKTKIKNSNSPMDLQKRVKEVEKLVGILDYEQIMELTKLIKTMAKW